MRLKPVLQLMTAAVLGSMIVSTSSGSGGPLVEHKTPGEVITAGDGLDGAAFNGRITAMLPVPDGSGDRYVAGDFSSYRGRPVRPIVRLRPDGSLQTTFTAAEILSRRIAAIAPAEDDSGDLYVTDYTVEPAASAGWRFHSTVRRIRADGTADERFAAATFTHEDTYVPDARFVPVVTSLAVEGSALYAAGRFGVVRFRRDGKRDAGFTYRTSAFHVVPAKDGSGHIYVTSNERIAPSGRHAAQRIVRLKPDGSRDPKFDSGSGTAAGWSIFTVVPVEDGSGDLFVGGSFANYGDPNPNGAQAVRLLARVDATGAVDRTAPRPLIDERRGAVTALAKADDGSGDWLVTQDQRISRYSAEGATQPDAGREPLSPRDRAGAGTVVTARTADR